MSFNKKASLEISIQAIVIVVLAMTLLGLGLGFIKGMFKNITSTTEGVSEQVKQRVLDDLIQSDKKISFPTTEIFIERGGSQVLTVGVRNKKDVSLNYKLAFKRISEQPPYTGTDQSIQDLVTKFVDNFQYGISDYTLGAAESDIRNIRLTMPSKMPTASYFLTFKVLEQPFPTPAAPNENIYAQKDFFVVVR